MEVSLCSVPLAASLACIANFERILAPEERARAYRFQTATLQQHFIIARGTLRTILGNCLNCPPADVPLDYGARGKPRIAGGHPLRFNLSHSGGRALYALSLDREIGVDLEQIGSMTDCELIARRFFSAGEIRDLLSLPPGQRNEAFYTCWTRKEAYIKACGDGLSMALDRFRVSLLPYEPPLLEAPADPHIWSLFDASPGPGYAAALVAEGTAPALRAWIFGDADDCAGYFR
jgi:4'-phosphopantetheinyl transferase